MNGLIRLANRLFILLLRLHPLAGVSDFYEEMQETYAQGIAESTNRGRIAVWQRVMHELFDLPRVILRSWLFGRKAMAQNFSSPEDLSNPTPWGTALISLLPFFLVGPVSLILSYLPFWTDPLWTRWIWPGEAIVMAVIFWIGILLGVKRGFPRWSYPHVMVGIISLAALVNELLNNTPRNNMQLLWILAVAAAWAAATIRWRSFRPFWSHIRQDWTQLSYCFFALIMLVLSTVDKEETPHLTLLVLLPSLLTLAGALLHLRSTTLTKRILALVLSLTLAMPVWVLSMSTGMMNTPSTRSEVFSVLFSAYFILLAILLAPALVGLIKRAEPNQETLK